MVDPRRVERADSAFGDQAAGADMERAAREMVVDGQDHAVVVGGVDHGLGVRDAEGHWLLDQDVLASIGGGNRLREMLVIASRDVGGVNVSSGELTRISGL